MGPNKLTPATIFLNLVSDWTLDQAENAAIDCGAEEVDHLEASPEDEPEKPVFEFKCDPFDIVSHILRLFVSAFVHCGCTVARGWGPGGSTLKNDENLTF